MGHSGPPLTAAMNAVATVQRPSLTGACGCVQVWAQATALARSPGIAGNVLTRKLAVKLLQRVTLTFLEPRVPAWRYERASTSLSHTLGSGAGGGEADGGAAGPEADGGEEFEVVEETEEAIELLLNGLKDKDTIVRWSSAKGLGRVLGRLPRVSAVALCIVCYPLLLSLRSGRPHRPPAVPSGG